MGQVSVSYGQLQTGRAKYDAGGVMGGEMINPRPPLSYTYQHVYANFSLYAKVSVESVFTPKLPLGVITTHLK